MRITQILTSRVGEWTKQFSNFPDAYIKRAMEQVYWKTPRGLPQYLPRNVQRKNYRFTMNRPWTGQAFQQNYPNTKRRKVFIEPVADWRFFRGDRVEVLVGKDKGKQGLIVQVIQERNWVVVEGLNAHLRRVGKDDNFPGIIVKSEAPLLVTSQVALVDPADLKATEIEWRFTEDGEKVRVSTRSGRIIPIPAATEETKDYKTRKTYKEQDKDTTVQVLEEITFAPKLQTFEMSIMDAMGIEDTRTPNKTFWY